MGETNELKSEFVRYERQNATSSIASHAGALWEVWRSRSVSMPYTYVSELLTKIKACFHPDAERSQ